MTDEEICLEYETSLASDGNPLSTCHKCGLITHRSNCPVCVGSDGEPISLSGDNVMDKAAAMSADGEEFDLEHALRYGEFIPVTIDDLKGRTNG
jgi:hypothetical protein